MLVWRLQEFYNWRREWKWMILQKQVLKRKRTLKVETIFIFKHVVPVSFCGCLHLNSSWYGNTFSVTFFRYWLDSLHLPFGYWKYDQTARFHKCDIVVNKFFTFEEKEQQRKYMHLYTSGFIWNSNRIYS